MAVELCRNETVLGFDTETRAAFRKGETYLPSLVQLAAADKVYLFRIQTPGVLEACRPLFENSALTKAGVAIHDDLKALQGMMPFTEAGFVELQKMSSQFGLKNNGLRGLAALLLGLRISKGAQTTNWEVPQLTQKQLLYAATDAWISREIFLALQNMKNSP